MGRRPKNSGDPDRYLSARESVFQYTRRIPKNLRELDHRRGLVRISLNTEDLAIARLKRDAFENADNEYWAALLSGSNSKTHKERYQSARSVAEALGYTYKTAMDLARTAPLGDLRQRFDELLNGGHGASSRSVEALLGGISVPKVSVVDAFEIYVAEIAPQELVNKSEPQRKAWLKVKRRAIARFIQLIGDKPISEISRDDARKVHQFWMQRIAPQIGSPTHSPSSGNRDLGNLRLLFREYHAHLGVEDLPNPFDKLSFEDGKTNSRPPFSVEWIETKFLQLGRLRDLNIEARGIFLAGIETGARSSETCNLQPQDIVLDVAVPHIIIAPQEDPQHRREIKTYTSRRTVPLVGVALEVFRQNREGFPRYRNREAALATHLTKFLRRNELLESAKHTAYSVRHSFEDRMKIANLSDELRRILMGHSIDRPKYGQGGSLEWRVAELKKIELPFDPEIV